MNIENSNNEEIILELKKVNKLLALIATQGRTQTDKIILLSQIGLTPKEIADILGITSNFVSVTLHHSRKSKKKGK